MDRLDPVIEKARTEDPEEILDLQKKAFQIEGERYNDFTIPPLTQTLEELQKDFNTKTFFVTRMGVKIVASINGAVDSRKICHIGRLMVHPEFRGQGLAEAITRHLMDYFSGCTKFKLFTGEKTKPAISLYEKLGFVITHRKEAGNYNLVFMEK